MCGDNNREKKCMGAIWYFDSYNTEWRIALTEESI